MTQGYDIKRVTTPIEDIEQLLCHYCKKIPLDPVMCGNCLKIFCCDCINIDLMQTTSESCKHTKRSLIPLISKQLSKLSLTCIYKENGCKESIEYEKIKDHEEKCRFGMILCPNKGCGLKLSKLGLEAHFKTCLNAWVKCEWCQQTRKRAEMTAHVEYCDLRPNCGEELKPKPTKIQSNYMTQCAIPTTPNSQDSAQISFLLSIIVEDQKIVKELSEKITMLHEAFKAQTEKINALYELQSRCGVNVAEGLCDKCRLSKGKCNSCQVPLCRVCSRDECSFCGNSLCKKCGSEKLLPCGSCNKLICSLCISKKCLGCMSIICAKCISECTLCNKNHGCLKCMKKCGVCGNNKICSDCMKCCYKCKKEKCIKCEKLKECKTCGSWGCENCISICDECRNVSCFNCQKKCDICNKNKCPKCDHRCTVVWASTGNRTHIQIKDVNSKKMIVTSKNILPKFFKAVIKLTNYRKCDRIGISSKMIQEEYGRGLSSNPGISWNEYSADLSCGYYAYNNAQTSSILTNKATDGGSHMLILTLDSNWNLSYELDGKSMGPAYYVVKQGSYYLAIDSYTSESKYEIISVEELKS